MAINIPLIDHISKPKAVFQALANAVKLQRCLGPPPLRQITLGVIHSRSQYCPRQLRNRNRGISRVSLSTRACLDVQLLGEFLVRNNASRSDLSFPIIAYPAVLSYRGGVRKPLHPSGMGRSSRNVSPPEITRPPKYSRRLSPLPPPLNRDMDIWHGSSRFEREFIMRVCQRHRPWIIRGWNGDGTLCHHLGEITWWTGLAYGSRIDGRVWRGLKLTRCWILWRRYGWYILFDIVEGRSVIY